MDSSNQESLETRNKDAVEDGAGGKGLEINKWLTRKRKHTNYQDKVEQDEDKDKLIIIEGQTLDAFKDRIKQPSTPSKISINGLYLIGIIGSKESIISEILQIYCF